MTSPILISDKYSNLGLSPTGILYFYDAEQSENISADVTEKIQSFFSINYSVGLLRLGLTHFNEPLPDSLSFWQ